MKVRLASHRLLDTARWGFSVHFSLVQIVNCFSALPKKCGPTGGIRKIPTPEPRTFLGVRDVRSRLLSALFPGLCMHMRRSIKNTHVLEMKESVYGRIIFLSRGTESKSANKIYVHLIRRIWREKGSKSLMPETCLASFLPEGKALMD